MMHGQHDTDTGVMHFGQLDEWLMVLLHGIFGKFGGLGVSEERGCVTQMDPVKCIGEQCWVGNVLKSSWWESDTVVIITIKLL